MQQIKVLINRCYGGFSVSKDLLKVLGLEGHLDNKMLGIVSDDSNAYRYEPYLIEAVEKLGLEKSSGECAQLDIVTVYLGIHINSDDGMESVEVGGYSL